MKKVAIIETVGGHGGLDFYLYGLYSSIMQYDFKPTIYTNDKTNREYFPCTIRKFFKQIYGKEPAIIRGIRFIIGAFRTLLDCLKNKTDLVHVHMFHFNKREYLLLKLFKLVGFKVVITVHDVECFEKFSHGRNRKNNYKKFLRKDSTIIVHTEYAKKDLLRKINLFCDYIHVVPGYDTDAKTLIANRQITKQEARQKVNLPQDKQIVLFFGHIKKTKGLNILIDAFSKVVSSNNNVILVIVGKVWKDNFDKYEIQIKNSNLNEHVITRINFVTNSEVPYYLKGTDIITLPYTKIYNSSILIRSMSLGVPIVCSDSGPFPEFIEHGRTGFLFENGNADKCADAINEALYDMNRINIIGNNAANEFDKLFTLSRVGEKTTDAYKKALQGTGDICLNSQTEGAPSI